MQAMRFGILMLLFFLGSHCLFAQAITGIISINNGTPVSNHPEGRVSLKIFAKGASEMMLSNNGSFIGAKWAPYEQAKTNFKLDSREDGIKTVYAKFRDASKTLISEVAIAQIELDRQPPYECSIVINAGAESTNSPEQNVMLEIFAKDADQMRVSNRSDYLESRWVPYSERMDRWKLVGLDGVKHVYVQFKDRAGNLSESVNDTILLDRLPPTDFRIKINNGERFTSNATVKLQLYAEEAVEYQVANGDWKPYAKEVEHTLPDPSTTGERVIPVRFKDRVGNLTRYTASKIYLDLSAPTLGKIMINNGNKYTREQKVHVKISAVGATYMMLSNTNEFHGGIWQPFNFMMPTWNLEDDLEGTKKVFVKFKDAAGNISEAVSDDIILDKTPPKNAKIDIITADGREITNNPESKVDLKLACEDARYMMISNSASFFDSKWEIYREEVKEWLLGSGGDSEKMVYAKFRDKAGNLSEIVLDKILLDTKPPIDNRVMINQNANYCNILDVNLQLSSRGGSEVQISNTGDFTGVIWQPLKQTIPWKVVGEDGLKKVVVRFRDEAYNVSDTVSDVIILDTKPPQDCDFQINRGDTITNDPNKVVVLICNARGASMMRLGTSTDLKAAKWRFYDDKNINFSLPGEDGMKTLYAQYMDEAGNVSDILSATIKLDRTPPMEVNISINEGKKGTNTDEVELALEARGAKMMWISNNYDFTDGQWEPFAPTKNWKLPPGDGLKIVYVKFKDRTSEAANISKPVAAKIGVDRTAPTEGRFEIDRGAKYTNNINKNVTLWLYAKDATKVKVSNTSDFTNVKPVSFKVLLNNFTLEGEDGEKTVYVQFCDDLGNCSATISQKIILDRQAPINEELIINEGKPFTNKHEVDLALKVEEGTEMMLGTDRHFNPPSRWEPFANAKKWVLAGRDGEKLVFARFRDAAGNVTSPISASILLDSQPPVATQVKINGGQAIGKGTHVRIKLLVTGADYMAVSNSPNFTGLEAIWQEFKSDFEWEVPALGYRTIYVKFKDKCDNESKPIHGAITLEEK